MPYGTKSPDTVRRYAREIHGFLLRRGVKAVVVACNTATAVALEELRHASAIPVLGVIEPGACAAVVRSKNKVIGVIGTPATIGSDAYGRALRALDPKVTVVGQACPLFVPLAEEGWASRAETRSIAKHYLDPLALSGADTVILGCTHYPLLRDDIAAALPPDVEIVDGGNAVAESLSELLVDLDLLSDVGTAPAPECHVTDTPPRFQEFLHRFLGDASLRTEHLPLEDLSSL